MEGRKRPRRRRTGSRARCGRGVRDGRWDDSVPLGGLFEGWGTERRLGRRGRSGRAAVL